MSPPAVLCLPLAAPSPRPYLVLNVFHLNSHSADMPVTRCQMGPWLQNTYCFMPGCQCWQRISVTCPCQKVCACVCEREKERGGTERLEREWKIDSIDLHLFDFHIFHFRNVSSNHLSLYSHYWPLTSEFCPDWNKLKFLCRFLLASLEN